MPKITVSPGSWQTIVTTEGDTAIQNQSPREMYVSTGTPTDLKDGILLPPWFALVVGSGYDVQISVFDADGFVYYEAV